MSRHSLEEINQLRQEMTKYKQSEEMLRLHEIRLQSLLNLNMMLNASEKEILDFILEECLKVTRSRFAYIALMSEDESIITIYSWSKTVMEKCAIIDAPMGFTVSETGLWGEPVRQRKPIIVNDYNAPNPYKKGYPEGHVQVRRFLGVPVFDMESIVATASVANKEEDYDESDVKAFTSMLNDMWRLIKYKRDEEKLRMYGYQQATIAEIGRHALVEVDINMLMEYIVTTIAKTIEIEYSKIMEILPDDSALSLRAGFGWKEGLVGNITVGTKTDSQAGYTLLSNEPVIVEDLRTEKRFRGSPLLFDHGVISSVSVIIAGSKKPFGVLGVYTKRKRKFTIDDIHFLQAAANILATAIERNQIEEELLKIRKLESLGILAGGIAHDFNNMLTAIIGNISLAKKYIKPGDRAYQLLIEGEKASLRAKGLTRQLLTFAKGGDPVKKTVFLKNLIKDTVSFTLSGSKSMCKYLIQEDIYPVEADEGQLCQAINNIIINAEQAMPEGGVIEIDCKNITISEENTFSLEKGRYVRIAIKDNGTGIPTELLHKIFDPYFTTKQKGSGLGLATTYSIIKRHNGYIDVDSNPVIGTTFYIYLPASDRGIKTKWVTDEEVSFSGRGKILFMDDEEPIRKIISEISINAKNEIAFARDGKEAIELYSKAKESGRPFDVVILDLTIPGGMGGKEAIESLLKIDPHVKAIASSGYHNDFTMANYKTYGFKGIIQKPFNFQEFIGIINTIINEE
ncbi:MAG: GAF domain-containing protein [Nitrospinae bacterium]|nr:GAF domain-containing protein [Nitrospinota bacterium]